MSRANITGPGKVGDGACQLEHAVVGARREVQLAHGRLHQPLARAIELAVAAHLGRPHVMSALVNNLVRLKRSAWHTRGGDALADRYFPVAPRCRISKHRRVQNNLGYLKRQESDSVAA